MGHPQWDSWKRTPEEREAQYQRQESKDSSADVRKESASGKGSRELTPSEAAETTGPVELQVLSTV